ncbi:MAG TPA: cyclophilin-like fold protein [Candidatus Nitrosopolaris sp.]|nr:cyclophilin-like fold protein [Candidatus Nitrosopolaris sp.]
MKELIKVVFSELNEYVSVELDDSRSPKTVKAILENLPIEVNINKWGQELYTDRTSIVAQDENAKSEVGLLDVAFWPEGRALCLFYGPTPISRAGKIVPASPVNLVGRIVSHDNNIVDKVENTSKVLIKQQ